MTKTNIKLTQRERGEQGTIDLQEKEKQDAMDTKEKKCKTKKNEMHAKESQLIKRCRDICQGRCREKQRRQMKLSRNKAKTQEERLD